MPWPKGKKRSAETRRKMSEAHQRRLADPAARERMETCLSASPSRGGYFSEEHRQHLSEAMRGKKKSKAHRESLRQKGLGQIHTEGTKQKISDANKGKHSKKGRVQSDAERQARSEAQKRRYQKPGERERQAVTIQKRWDESGNKHRSETIEKMKEARAQQVLPLVDTKPELAVQAILRLLRARFETHHAVRGLGRHQWDLVVRSRRLLIEVDGCYWHGCERCCPHSEIGQKNRLRDQALNERAAAKGWRVLRIWEHDILEGAAFEIVEEATKQGIFESVG